MRGDNKNSLGPPVYNPNGTSNSSSVFVGRYIYNNRPHLCTACMRCGLIIISVLMPITLTSTEARVRGGSFQERGKFSGGGVQDRCTGRNVLHSRRRGWSVVLASVIRRSHRVGAALITGRPGVQAALACGLVCMADRPAAYRVPPTIAATILLALAPKKTRPGPAANEDSF